MQSQIVVVVEKREAFIIVHYFQLCKLLYSVMWYCPTMYSNAVSDALIQCCFVCENRFCGVFAGQLMQPASSSKSSKPAPAKRLIALCTSFAVSGMAHEVMFW